jgi:4-alpha-glucanotransferase
MTDSLHKLARLYNIQADYRDGLGQSRKAAPEAILKVLQALGAPLASLDDIPDALHQRRQTLWQRAVEPVTIAWEGQPLLLRMRLPGRFADSVVHYRVTFENGGEIKGDCSAVDSFTPAPKVIDGTRYVARRLTLSANLPLGYHGLHLQVGNLDFDSLLISAPLHAYAPEGEARRWGLFCPLYALNSGRSWGAGDFSDLGDLIEFTKELKAHAAATLPLLASFLDEPFNPSPYAPVSRLFWNEIYLDLEGVAELADCAQAQAMLDSEELRRELAAMRSQPLVDYRKAMALKRNILIPLSRSLLQGTSARNDSFKEFVDTHPRVRDYAAFRAAVERARTTWRYWQPAAREGHLTANDYDRNDQDYHLYVQWLCVEQIGALSHRANRSGTGLYLDFPLGVNGDGYDVWRERHLFALAASGGAPPDELFIKGQNWGFPPFQPDALRAQGYRYYIDCLRHHMGGAIMLRVDHVMGLHRAFWIPEGFDATDGMYVRYPASEFYAIFNLESQRHRVRIVGENLGTVPDYVNEALARHKILGMHVGQFGVGTDPAAALQAAPRHTVASLNTHDTATFIGFWSGGDIQDRLALGLIKAEQASDEHRHRAAQRQALAAFLQTQGYLTEANPDAGAVLRAWLIFLAGQSEEFLLVNLEDLGLEGAPQNVPGTWQERPNWRRKGRFTLADIRAKEPLMMVLRTISDKRSRIG